MPRKLTNLSRERIREWGKACEPVLICRVIGKRKWAIVSNLTKDGNYKAAQIVLANLFNEYMSYVNAGTEYRYIRKSDLSKYIES